MEAAGTRQTSRLMMGYSRPLDTAHDTLLDTELLACHPINGGLCSRPALLHYGWSWYAWQYNARNVRTQ
jgi:hypothetical protein